MRLIAPLLAGGMLASAAFAQPAAVDLGAVSVRDAQGTAVTLDDLVEGPTILHFWATWCAPCREELPAIERFAQRLERGLALISVDTADYARVVAFLDDLGVELVSYQQASGNVGAAFGILGYPATAVVDEAGAVLFFRQGVVDWADGEGLKSLVTGSAPENP